jgi:hypothetical protein
VSAGDVFLHRMIKVNKLVTQKPAGQKRRNLTSSRKFDQSKKISNQISPNLTSGQFFEKNLLSLL